MLINISFVTECTLQQGEGTLPSFVYLWPWHVMGLSEDLTGMGSYSKNLSSLQVGHLNGTGSSFSWNRTSKRIVLTMLISNDVKTKTVGSNG